MFFWGGWEGEERASKVFYHLHFSGKFVSRWTLARFFFLLSFPSFPFPNGRRIWENAASVLIIIISEGREVSPFLSLLSVLVKAFCD